MLDLARPEGLHARPLALIIRWPDLNVYAERPRPQMRDKAIRH